MDRQAIEQAADVAATAFLAAKAGGQSHGQAIATAVRAMYPAPVARRVLRDMGTLRMVQQVEEAQDGPAVDARIEALIARMERQLATA